MEYNPEKPILAQLRALEVDEVITFPVQRMNTVKCLASTYGLIDGRTYSTSTNRADKTISVTRTA